MYISIYFEARNVGIIYQNLGFDRPARMSALVVSPVRDKIVAERVAAHAALAQLDNVLAFHRVFGATGQCPCVPQGCF